VAVLHTTGLRNRISIPDKSKRYFSLPKPQQPFKETPSFSSAVDNEGSFLAVKTEDENTEKKVLNKTFHGRRHVRSS
jgi:hypothetical protein